MKKHRFTVIIEKDEDGLYKVEIQNTETESVTHQNVPLYEIYMEDIRHSKNQQWMTAYYVVLLQASLIGFHNIISGHISPSFICLEKASMIVSSILVSRQGFLFLEHYRDLINVYRKEAKPDSGKGDDQGTLIINTFKIIFVVSTLFVTSFVCLF